MMLWTVGTMVIAEPLLIRWFGLEGAILAMVIAHFVGMLWGFYKLIQAKYVVRINFSEFKFDLTMVWRILRITGPAILQRGFPNIAMVILMRLIAGYGAQTLAAWVIIRRLSSFAFLIGMGISKMSYIMSKLLIAFFYILLYSIFSSILIFNRLGMSASFIIQNIIVNCLIC